MAFVAISRLAARNGILGVKQAFLLPRASPKMLAPCHHMTKFDDNHDEKNYRLGRPLSPHLTVYKMEATMLLSITHRITGTVMGGYCAIFGAAALYMPHDFNYYCVALESLQLPALVIFAGKFCLGFPFVYHAINGIRHLTWDTGSYITKQGVYTTGYTMLAAVTASLAAVMFM